MTKRSPAGGLGRRDFMRVAGLPLLEGLIQSNVPARITDAPSGGGLPGPLGVPGPFPGRVVEARNPAMIKNGIRSREQIARTVGRGLIGLTGADDEVSAWRAFFEPGDVVGIKMNPVGSPLAGSSREVLWAVIEGLRSAGVATKDMVVFDRYKEEFLKAGMDKDVPYGIAWGGLTGENDDRQMTLNFPGDPIAGYDPDEFVKMSLVHRGYDPKDDRTRRSHLGLLITRRVNKLVLLPVLKDHASAGVTGALKNMSHGLVNNVARSHSSPDTNVCNQFIPEVVSHPILCKKSVLQILDGIRGVYQGGPFGKKLEWTWEYNALLFATDPVAMDRIAWRIIDRKRREAGLPPVGAAGKLGQDSRRERFDFRQPQHIALAASLGLGVFRLREEAGVDAGAGTFIDHRIIQVT